jgi:hypothetical protein
LQALIKIFDRFVNAGSIMLQLLLVVHHLPACPAGEEQSKVEVLSSRLEELGEDVDKLLEAVTAAADDEDDEQNDGEQHEDGELL